MKTLISFLLLASTSQAANFATLSEIEQNEVVTVYTNEKYCPSECVAIDGVDVEVFDVIDGQLIENESKKQAKEAKQKADKDAAKALKEAKKTRQAEIKAMAQKPGNLTTAEIQRLLKVLAEEKAGEADPDLSEQVIKLKTTTPNP